MLTHGRIQTLIHFLESGFFSRTMKVLLISSWLVMLVIIYNLQGYRNFNSEEAMDSAQLARNISEGRGYTTFFVRPFSAYLLQRKAAGANQSATAAIGADATRMHNNHPDLANPPVYPVFLAGLMKTLKFKYDVVTNQSFWSVGGNFRHYQPEFLIDLANEALLIAAAFLTFFIARKLFDRTAAWLSAILVIHTQLLWRFSVSGLSTILLIDIFLLLVIGLLKFEEAVNPPEGQTPAKNPLIWSVLLGLIIGVGMLTRYSFGWLLVPMIVYLALFGGPRRVLHIFTLGCTFAVLVVPWILRNLHVSGTLFGVSGYAVAEGTVFFPGASLESSIHPFLNGLFRVLPYLIKLRTNLRDILDNEVMTFTGSWSLMLFFSGLMLGFRSQTAKRIRYFVVFSLVTFIVVEALGRTHLSDDVPVLNSENLLVILAPLTFIYGVVFFLIFVDQMKVPLEQLRIVIRAGLALLCSLSMITHTGATKPNPLAYPPYHPPDIQGLSKQMGPDDLMMSDVPWAVAWYGHQECIGLTLNAKDDFFSVYDYVKPINALYLTPKTMDGKFLTEMAHSDDDTWTQFSLLVGMQNKYPPNFPLKNARVMRSGLFLSDRSM